MFLKSFLFNTILTCSRAYLQNTKIKVFNEKFDIRSELACLNGYGNLVENNVRALFKKCFCLQNVFHNFYCGDKIQYIESLCIIVEDCAHRLKSAFVCMIMRSQLLLSH